MARLIRIEYAGATYHVMGRGDQGQAISRNATTGGTGSMGICFKYVKQTLGKGRWATYSGEAKRAHGEAEAQRL
jgi:hypothetical protein